MIPSILCDSVRFKKTLKSGTMKNVSKEEIGLLRTLPSVVCFDDDYSSNSSKLQLTTIKIIKSESHKRNLNSAFLFDDEKPQIWRSHDLILD